MKRFVWVLALLSALLLNAGPVWADGEFYVIAGGGAAVGTKITSLPYTINSPGFYYVTGNLSCVGYDGITINCNDVTIDLMGFRLSGDRNGMGISMDGRKNVEIRNGTLQNWIIGIYETGTFAQNIRVINVRAEDFVTTGFFLFGVNHLIKGCVVSDCSGESGYGIYAQTNSAISGNQVNNCLFTGISGYGGTISNNVVNNCGSYGIDGNGNIRGNTVYSSSSGNGIGIKCSFAGNVIGNMVYTNSAGQTGISLSTSIDTPIIMDQNTVSGTGTHYFGGSTATVWGGKTEANPWGSSAGHP